MCGTSTSNKEPNFSKNNAKGIGIIHKFSATILVESAHGPASEHLGMISHLHTPAQPELEPQELTSFWRSAWDLAADAGKRSCTINVPNSLANAKHAASVLRKQPLKFLSINFGTKNLCTIMQSPENVQKTYQS